MTSPAGTGRRLQRQHGKSAPLRGIPSRGPQSLLVEGEGIIRGGPRVKGSPLIVFLVSFVTRQKKLALTLPPSADRNKPTLEKMENPFCFLHFVHPYPAGIL